MDLMNASAYLNRFFSNLVKYLGPLRDEPKALYPLAAHADPTDVGLRGEMTAAVLNLHKERKIRYIPSSAFGKIPFEPTPVVRSLEAAVTDWLKYLGVAETVHSIDKGKLGHELKVSLTGGGPNHDLTHVGVGVSQVLPILVMSLLAERDTTLIFEQPELHLHPKVQTRLSDFFLSIALNGKQCLIETHSEYLINRVRYRAAEESKDNRVTKNLKVYFVEKTDNSSSFREVKVNEYGAILDWPEGFFDQSPREAEDILKAAMKKRRAERKGGAQNG
jgi:predicted ATPase